MISSYNIYNVVHIEPVEDDGKNEGNPNTHTYIKVYNNNE